MTGRKPRSEKEEEGSAGVAVRGTAKVLNCLRAAALV